jgi:hypothetical protein
MNFEELLDTMKLDAYERQQMSVFTLCVVENMIDKFASYGRFADFFEDCIIYAKAVRQPIDFAKLKTIRAAQPKPKKTSFSSPRAEAVDVNKATSDQIWLPASLNAWIHKSYAENIDRWTSYEASNEVRAYISRYGSKEIDKQRSRFMAQLETFTPEKIKEMEIKRSAFPNFDDMTHPYEAILETFVKMQEEATAPIPKETAFEDMPVRLTPLTCAGSIVQAKAKGDEKKAAWLLDQEYVLTGEVGESNAISYLNRLKLQRESITIDVHIEEQPKAQAYKKDSTNSNVIDISKYKTPENSKQIEDWLTSINVKEPESNYNPFDEEEDFDSPVLL